MHYGKEFVRPKIRNWFPSGEAAKLYEKLKNKVQPLPPEAKNNFKNWKHIAQWVKDGTLHGGHGPGSRPFFLDNIPGPIVMESKPRERELVCDEAAIFKKQYPQYDWEAIIAEQSAQKSRPPKQYVKDRARV